MRKKAISLLLVLGILSGYHCNVSAAVSVSGQVCERNGNKLEFSGSTTSKNETLMLKIYNSEYGETKASGFVYLDTVKTGADGSFSVTVTMPETLADGSSATGEYIMVYSDGSGSDTSKFMYTVPSEAVAVYEALATKTADELKTEFGGSFADEAELAGVDMTAYNKLADDDKKVLLQWFAKQRTEVGTDNINLLNDCIYIKYISICGADELDEVAAAINPTYGDYVYNNLAESEKGIVAKYLAGGKYSEYEEVNQAFGTAMVLAKISVAKAADITDLIENNAELLGLNGSVAYENYTDMSASDRLKVNEKLVSAISGSVTSVADLIYKLGNAVDKVKELSGSSSPSGGGGGGGGSSWDSSNLNDPIVSKYDKPQSVANANQGKTEVSFTDISNVYIDNASDYWKGDSIQLAVCPVGKTYATEISLVHNEAAQTSSIYSSQNTEDEVARVKLATKRVNGKTIYETAIPWDITFTKETTYTYTTEGYKVEEADNLDENGLPEKCLLSFAINENDGAGRAYLVQVDNGGITIGKKSSDPFPLLELLEEGKDWYAWIEGKKEITTGTDSVFDVYLVNKGDAKNVTIELPLFNSKENIKIPAKSGIRREFKYNPTQYGQKTVECIVTEGNNKGTKKYMLTHFHRNLCLMAVNMRYIRSITVGSMRVWVNFKRW